MGDWEQSYGIAVIKCRLVYDKPVLNSNNKDGPKDNTVAISSRKEESTSTQVEQNSSQPSSGVTSRPKRILTTNFATVVEHVITGNLGTYTGTDSKFLTSIDVPIDLKKFCAPVTGTDEPILKLRNIYFESCKIAKLTFVTENKAAVEQMLSEVPNVSMKIVPENTRFEGLTVFEYTVQSMNWLAELVKVYFKHLCNGIARITDSIKLSGARLCILPGFVTLAMINYMALINAGETITFLNHKFATSHYDFGSIYFELRMASYVVPDKKLTEFLEGKEKLYKEIKSIKGTVFIEFVTIYGDMISFIRSRFNVARPPRRGEIEQFEYVF